MVTRHETNALRLRSPGEVWLKESMFLTFLKQFDPRLILELRSFELFPQSIDKPGVVEKCCGRGYFSSIHNGHIHGDSSSFIETVEYPRRYKKSCNDGWLCWVHHYFTEAQCDPEKYRFEVELEFVQCLANPSYLNCKLMSTHLWYKLQTLVDFRWPFLHTVLAQRGFFKEKEFVNYLDYLQYWKKQEYAQYLK